jgi:hypothetical protein
MTGTALVNGFEVHDRKCCFPDCKTDAVFGIAVSIPAKGLPLDVHMPLQLIIGAKVCYAHLLEAEKNIKTVIDFEQSPQLVEIIEKETQGKAPVDYSRAFVVGLKLNSEEWRRFMAPRG